MRTQSFRVVAIMWLLLPIVAGAQSPPTIPTVVAEAMSLEWSMFGKPTFFDGTSPVNWPKDLVPAGTRVIGGAAVGMMGGIQLQTTVVAFGRGANPDSILRALILAAGFRRAEDAPIERQGFLTTPMTATTEPPKFCRGISLVTYAPVDSARDPLVVAIRLMEGSLAVSSCNGRRDRFSGMDQREPVDIPNLVPPAGGQSLGGGSSGGGDGERMYHQTLIARMETDSVLSHYARALSAGGWKAAGKMESAGRTASQRFAVTQGQEKWDALLVVVSSGNRHQVMIYLTRTG